MILSTIPILWALLGYFSKYIILYLRLYYSNVPTIGVAINMTANEVPHMTAYTLTPIVA
jgi:hypothetical protein